MYILEKDGTNCMNDLIQTIDCVTKEEIDTIKDYIQEEWWQPTTIFGMSGSEVNTDVRSNDRISLHDTSIAAEIIHAGMNRALLTYRDQLYNVDPYFTNFPVPGSWRTNCWREGIQLLRYKEGQYYNWHHDTAADINVNEYNRTISVVLYLSDDFEGGRTVFPHRAYKPKAGQALIFPSNWCFPHKCEPITKGEKLASVSWYYTRYNFD